MRPFRSTTGIVLLLSLATVLSCQRPSRPKVTVTKEQLIARLVEKGERSLPGHRETAYAAYRFAYFYAPQDGSTRAKYEAAGTPVGLIANVQATHNRIDRMAGPGDFRDFPASTPEMDLVNLKMLLDEGLVGDLSYTTYSAEQRALFATFPPSDTGASDGREVCVFTKEAFYPIVGVKELYGDPSTEVSSSGKTTLTYGRFRLIADDRRYVRLVLFPLFPK